MSVAAPMPSAWRAYAAALLHRRAPGEPAPIQRVATGFRFDPRHAARYHDACGFDDGIPACTYPFVAAFPLMLSLLGDRASPVGFAGLVHLGSAIRRAAPLSYDDIHDVHCDAHGFERTERGLEFSVRLAFHAHGMEVWSCDNRILSRTGTRRPRASRDPDVPAGEVVGGFMADTRSARRYARVSRDWNPIHLGIVTARAVGLPRPIAHGMWTLARALAAVGARDAAHVEARFTAPLRLPAHAEVRRDGDAFSVVDAASARVVVVGATTPTLHRIGEFPAVTGEQHRLPGIRGAQ